MSNPPNAGMGLLMAGLALGVTLGLIIATVVRPPCAPAAPAPVPTVSRSMLQGAQR